MAVRCAGGEWLSDRVHRNAPCSTFPFLAAQQDGPERCTRHCRNDAAWPLPASARQEQGFADPKDSLIARRKFVDHMLAIEDSIRGLLKVHGLKLGLVHRARFAAKVEAMLADAPELRLAIEPLLEVRNAMRVKKTMLDRQLSQMAR